jgi:hypothetical protein
MIQSFQSFVEGNEVSEASTRTNSDAGKIRQALANAGHTGKYKIYSDKNKTGIVHKVHMETFHNKSEIEGHLKKAFGDRFHKAEDSKNSDSGFKDGKYRTAPSYLIHVAHKES